MEKKIRNLGEIEWVNILKGFGILMVVVGHMTESQSKSGQLIYLFHMPLFFLISGYLFKPDKDLKNYFRKKSIHLMLPYISFLILIYLIPQIVLMFIDHNPSFYNLLHIVKTGLVGGRELKGSAGTLWFISCLFLSQQLINILVSKYSAKLATCLVIFFFILGYIHSIFFRQYWLPLGLDVVLGAVPIFYIGYIFKSYEMHIHLIVPASIIALLSIVIIFKEYLLAYDMKSANYGFPLISIIFALSINYVLIYICKLFRNSKLVSLVISIGNASLIIMTVHKVILENTTSMTSYTQEILRFLIAVTVSYAAYSLIKKFRTTRALLLGSESDLKYLKDIHFKICIRNFF